jgi:protein TonB
MKKSTAAVAAMSLVACGAFLTSPARPSTVPQPAVTPQEAALQTFGGKIVSQNGVRFVLKDYDNDLWYHIDDQQKAGNLLGKYVLITGGYDGLTGTIRVRNIVEATPDEITAANNAKREMELAKRAPPAATPAPSARPSEPSPKPPQASPTPSQPSSPGQAAPAIAAPRAEAQVTPKAQPVPRTERKTPESPAREAPVASVLALPEEAVSASASVAISSRRFVAMPPNYNSQVEVVKNLAVGKLLNRVSPSYPVEAREQGIEGTVRLHGVIDEDGRIRNLEPTDGPQVLVGAALTAVREWRYAPTMFEGRRIKVQDDIKLVFRLPK